MLVERLSVRRVAQELGISRNTVRRYVEGAPPGVRKETTRPSPVKDRVRSRVAELLEEAKHWTGGKQRLTSVRLHEILLGEGQLVGERTVRELVAEWKRVRREVFVPLTYRPGDLAEVDFFEVLVDVGGKRQKAWMFLMRLMHSGRDFAWLYGRQDQVCFLDGHVRAFEHFGGVAHRALYDNLKPAVTKILVGSERELSLRFVAMANHYLLEPCFARPGTGHDKGGVEARGKGIRWQHLVPIPSGPDLATVSAQLLARLDARAATKRDSERRTVAERFADEQARMLPLPPTAFRAAVVHHPRVWRRSLVRVEGAFYSVWSEWAGLDVRAFAGADTIEIVGPDERVVIHPRVRPGKKQVDYRHYLRELRKKPQAVRQVADELIRDLGEPYAELWRTLVDEHGPKDAARRFARVLGAIVDLGEHVVAARVRAAIENGDPVLLALQPNAPLPVALSVDALPAALSGHDVEAGRATDYDALLGGAS
ncbi:MAG: IS21 family transposase [Kofleriaceae bacterium]|nr:IS21 family transposase [Kofleriaceae bacterium]MCB9564177.1 IS21 family transposase [Kofleriaceae bacterium]